MADSCNESDPVVSQGTLAVVDTGQACEMGVKYSLGDR